MLSIDDVIAKINKDGKPQNWGELTDRILQLWDDNPARVRMESHQFYKGELQELVEEGRHAALPGCGAAGCLIGWAGWVMEAPYYKLSDALYALKTHTDVGFARPLYHICYDDWPESKSGTREYADEVIQKVREVREHFRVEMDSTPVVIAGR